MKYLCKIYLQTYLTSPLSNDETIVVSIAWKYTTMFETHPQSQTGPFTGTGFGAGFYLIRGNRSRDRENKSPIPPDSIIAYVPVSFDAMIALLEI